MPELWAKYQLLWHIQIRRPTFRFVWRTMKWQLYHPHTWIVFSTHGMSAQQFSISINVVPAYTAARPDVNQVWKRRARPPMGTRRIWILIFPYRYVHDNSGRVAARRHRTGLSGTVNFYHHHRHRNVNSYRGLISSCYCKGQDVVIFSEYIWLWTPSETQ